MESTSESYRTRLLSLHGIQRLEAPLTWVNSRRTIHILQIYSSYLSYRDRANGRDPYFNEEIIRSFEDLLRRGPQGPLKVDALSWLARGCRARGERVWAERYMRELIDFLLHERDPLARSFMNEMETWFIEWGETKKAAELAGRRQAELDAEASDYSNAIQVS